MSQCLQPCAEQSHLVSDPVVLAAMLMNAGLVSLRTFAMPAMTNTIALLLASTAMTTIAFHTPTTSIRRGFSASSRPLMAGRKNIREEKGYWPGEWVCADCGYIYAPSEPIPFEEQPRGFVCPQCAGPRRRFVKKAGDVVGTLDDSALYIGTFIGLAIVGALLYFGLSD